MADEDRNDAPNLVELVEDEEIEGPGLCVPMFTNGRGNQPQA